MKNLRGIYLLTQPPWASLEVCLARIGQAIQGGVRMVQYRHKEAAPAQRYEEAEAILAYCRQRGIPLLINDDVDLARAIQADGVHLGVEDSSPTLARNLLGEGAMIGVSCYNQLDNAKKAIACGADYVAFGAFFPSTTKPDAVRASPVLLQQAKQMFSVPVVAIGGITPENGADLVVAGADFLAVASGIFQANHVMQAALAYRSLYPDF